MLDAIVNRRSIRRYAEAAIPDQLVEQLQEAMLRAPSSRNLQPWRFIFVTDPELLDALSHARPKFADFIGSAPLGVVIVGDESASDCWIEDCSLAAAMLQIQATELGLGTCWTQIRARDHEDGRPAGTWIHKTLEIDPELRVLCMIAVGYPAEDKAPKDRESLAWQKIENR